MVFARRMGKKCPLFNRAFYRMMSPPRLNPAMRARIWKPGQSGNPAGVSKAYLEAVQDLGGPPMALSPGAERTRRWRERRQQCHVVVNLILAPEATDEL